MSSTTSVHVCSERRWRVEGDQSLGLDGADVARILVITAGPGKGAVDKSASVAVSGKAAELVGGLFERAACGQAAADTREDRRVVEHGGILRILVAGAGKDRRESRERAVLRGSPEPPADDAAALAA